jgi:hypothetical protein
VSRTGCPLRALRALKPAHVGLRACAGTRAGARLGRPEGILCRSTEVNRAKLPEWMNFEITRYQYVGNQPEHLAWSMRWHVDWDRLSRPGIIDIQFEIFSDYGSHIARYPTSRDYHASTGRRAFCCGAGKTPSLISTRSWPTTALSMRWKSTSFESGHQLLETHPQRMCGTCDRLYARFGGRVSLEPSYTSKGNDAGVDRAENDLHFISSGK